MNYYQQKVIKGKLYCRYSPSDRWTPVFETNKKAIKPILNVSESLDLIVRVQEFCDFLSFQIGCEMEIRRINLEAGDAITKRAIINLN